MASTIFLSIIAVLSGCLLATTMISSHNTEKRRRRVLEDWEKRTSATKSTTGEYSVRPDPANRPKGDVIREDFRNPILPQPPQPAPLRSYKENKHTGGN